MFSQYAARCWVTYEEFERVAFQEISQVKLNIFDSEIVSFETIPDCYRM